MTDQQGASLERMLRDMERRLQKLETDARVKPGLEIDFPAPPQASPIANQASMTAGATAPSSYSQAYAEQLREDIRVTRQYAFDLTVKLRGTSPPIILP